MFQMPLLIQISLGSFAGSHCDLSGPPPRSGQSPFVLFFFFSKDSEANCQELNVQCHNLTGELSPFPEKYFLLVFFVTGCTGPLVLEGERYTSFGLWHCLGTMPWEVNAGWSGSCPLCSEGCRAGIGRIVGPGWLKSPQRALSTLLLCLWQWEAQCGRAEPENLELKMCCALQGCRGPRNI